MHFFSFCVNKERFKDGSSEIVEMTNVKEILKKYSAALGV